MKLSIYQLKQNAAAMIAFADGKPIQFIPANSDRWTDYLNAHMMPDFANRPFRPKPEPASRPWNTPEDVPLHCWLRSKTIGNMHLVTSLADEGTWGHVLGRLLWRDLHGYEYSTDRKTWHPCTVEDAQ